MEHQLAQDEARARRSASGSAAAVVVVASEAARRKAIEPSRIFAESRQSSRFPKKNVTAGTHVAMQSGAFSLGSSRSTSIDPRDLVNLDDDHLAELAADSTNFIRLRAARDE